MADTKDKKYHIMTYGCQMNAHESEKMAGIMMQNGFVTAENKEEAALILLNTCCIRESAEKKIMGNIGALKALKMANRDLKIIVSGCMAQQEGVGEKLLKRFPFIDAVLGTNNIGELDSIIKDLFKKQKKILHIYNTRGELTEGIDALRNTFPLAFVNIMYGCNNYCSYCIVPYVRGRERSRQPGAIIDEIKKLCDEGFKEITLLGQNVNSYGKDLPEALSFAKLLERIYNETNIPRIRFMTSHPKDLSDELIDAYANLPSLCAHIHLPVQSGSDRILNLMNRRYTSGHYKALIEKLRSKKNDIAISTDIITGFPTETEEDFNETLDLVRTVRFDSAFTFIYSKRSGTKAAAMDGQIPREVKAERIGQLIALQNSITQEINNAMVGKIETILAESLSTRNSSHIAGRTSSSKMVNLAGSKDLIGKFIDVKITETKKTTLFGEICRK